MSSTGPNSTPPPETSEAGTLDHGAHQHLLQAFQEQQLHLRNQLVTNDDLRTFQVHGSGEGPSPTFHFPELRLVGGVDISFTGEGFGTAVAGLVVLEFPSMNVVYAKFKECRFDLPYIPGYLAFREVPILQGMVRELREQAPELCPQIVLVDGNGVLHPRGFGLACHLGVVTNLPTIGVAKNFLQIDAEKDLTVARVRERMQQILDGGGDELALVGQSGRTWGAAVCTPGTTKPIYISTGHRVSLPTAVALVRECCKFRIPEPIRMADQLTRQYIRNMAGRPSA
ncbi:hypothetical protein H4R33_003265 [Dimargaris cristalligena]|nr:hypothetical protein H4R33_003265 [Dimargaris cristalligena]